MKPPIPSIEKVLQRPSAQALARTYGRPAVVAAAREAAGDLRASWSAGHAVARSQEEALQHLETALVAHLEAALRGSLAPVINATGVVVHTNLGRAPLAAEAVERIAALGTGYTNLEYGLEAGARGRRDVHAEHLLRRLTGAEAAVVVNNNAAATLLVLAALASGREVVISRGELVEIGGGFRVPDVMAQSGAILREVGTTNRTRVADYVAATGPATALWLRVHPSNFRIEGFTERPALRDLASAAQQCGVTVVEDLGSGNMLDAVSGAGALAAVGDEPTVRGTLQEGAALTFFSGDKILGGPQAGIIVGRADLIDRVRRHPLMRAMRAGKLTYAALEATLLEYLRDRAHRTVPVVRMLALQAHDIEERASRIVAEARSGVLRLDIVDGFSAVGGGSAPGAALPTRLIALSSDTLDAETIEAALRAFDPPIISRILDDRVVLDLRTVREEEDRVVAGAIVAVAL
jgi:L-seryl-tRNA(Ser) seleniumtransferase